MDAVLLKQSTKNFRALCDIKVGTARFQNRHRGAVVFDAEAVVLVRPDYVEPDRVAIKPCKASSHGQACGSLANPQAFTELLAKLLFHTGNSN